MNVEIYGSSTCSRRCDHTDTTLYVLLLSRIQCCAPPCWRAGMALRLQRPVELVVSAAASAVVAAVQCLTSAARYTFRTARSYKVYAALAFKQLGLRLRVNSKLQDIIRCKITDEVSSPTEVLSNVAAVAGIDSVDSEEFAALMDLTDPLRRFRREFALPMHSDGTEQVYLTGHSLGLMPLSTFTGVLAELAKWAAKGVGGHFTGELPWAQCEEKLTDLMAEVVGAKDPALEVAAMNSLTVNLHMLMAAFYRPTKGRAGILIEAGAFPSDRYAARSQILHHGFDPEIFFFEVQPREDGLLHEEASRVVVPYFKRVPCGQTAC
eukprot:6182871-Pleurochrysis_carterae.AAC.1